VLGDYDMNDVVVRYRAREVLNASRAVATLELDLRLDARGGQLRNGFALSLPGVLPGQVESVVLTRNGEAVTTPVLLTGVTGERGGAVFEIFTDATALMPADNAPSCATTGYRNTGKDCPIQDGVRFKLVVNFKTALSTFPSAPYDPFIFNSNGTPMAKGVEIHLPGREPTTRADRALMGTRDDRPVAGKATGYKSTRGLPWALDIPVEWAYPYEFMDVGHVYPLIVPWAQSAGTAHRNWYELNPANASKTFRNSR
jgi:LruC domain-containing protein